MLSRLQKRIEIVITQTVQEIFEQARVVEPVSLDYPKDKQHGDFACNVALRLAAALKQPPMVIAEQIHKTLPQRLKEAGLETVIRSMEVKKPGFINIFLTPAAFYEILTELFAAPEDAGRSGANKGQRVQIEFVSANPTGPLSVAHARQAAVGDALGNILAMTGAEVTKEYYVNDEGNQINLLGESIRCRGLEYFGEQRELPEGGYQGDYIREIAEDFIKEKKIKDAAALNRTSLEELSQFGVRALMDVIKKELEDFRVRFDVWAHQSKIADRPAVKKTLTALEKKKYIYEHEGALWFRSTQFGDDKDRVVRKSDGSYTYLAPDIVYHKDKFDRGFTRVVNIWGPDHHGYIPRIKAAVQALGQDAKALDVLIVQLATIYRDGKPVSMSTRKGQYISLREVMDEVGVDAARYFFLMRHIEVHLDFDLELAKKETPENPVYYIQYAHARINSILRLAKERGVVPKHKGFVRLIEEEEIDLLKKVGLLPDTLLACVSQMDPYALGSYLHELATAFHKFYDNHRVIGDDPDLSAERLALIEAVRIVLAKGLNLLGIHAPEKM